MREERGCTIGKLIDEFDGYLCDCCGASDRTRLRYTSHARTFLQERFGSSPPDLGKLAVADVIAFVTERAARYKPKTTQLAAAAIRSFLRFLCITRRCDERLVSAVPTIPSFRLHSIPASLSDEQLTHLLHCIDRSRPVGSRDYADDPMYGEPRTPSRGSCPPFPRRYRLASGHPSNTDKQGTSLRRVATGR